VDQVGSGTQADVVAAICHGLVVSQRSSGLATTILKSAFDSNVDCADSYTLLLLRRHSQLLVNGLLCFLAFDPFWYFGV